MKRRVFLRTLPVMAGYLFLGVAFGVALKGKGYGWPWALYMSGCIYAGSMQFALLEALSAPFAPLTAALLTLMVNARHIFYGFSMLEPYRRIGRGRWYAIFALTDETYSLVVGGAPEGTDPGRWYTAVSALDQCYWVAGSLLGSLLGELLPASATRGIDFAMTALFAVIATEQTTAAVRTARERLAAGEPAFPVWREALLPLGMGLVLTLGCLLLWGSGTFLLYAMGGMALCFAAWYARERKGERA